MSIRIVDPFAAQWWTLPGQDGEKATAARFRIQGADGIGQAEIADAIAFDGDDIQLSARAIGLLIRHCVIDWDGVFDKNGAAVSLPRDPRDVQKLLPYAVQAQLARHLFSVCFVTPEEKKT